MTNAEIATLTGLTAFQVAGMSRQLDWTGVDLPTMKRFMHACGLDIEDPVQLKRARAYLRGKRKNGLAIPPRFTFSQEAPHWETELKPLAEILINASKTSKTPNKA